MAGIFSFWKLHVFFDAVGKSLFPCPRGKKDRAPGRRVDGITEETKARKLLSNDARTDLARVNAHLELLLEIFETENWKGFEKKIAT